MSYYRQQGFLTLVAVLFIVVIAFLGVAASYMFTASAFSTSNTTAATKSLYLAEAALEQATHLLMTPTLTSRDDCTGLSLTNSFGAGSYSVTGGSPTYVSSPTTLTSALTADSTTTSITVASTSNYQSSGRIMIDRELINYTSVDATHFLGVQRAVDSSVLAAHASGAVVSQFQCNLTAQGGIPNLSTPASPGNPGGKRILTEGVQLQEAWAVGNNVSSNVTVARWNKPTELTWTNASIASSNDLYGISMLSYADVWVVGQASKFFHWDGNAWTATTLSAPTGTIFRDIFCTASDNCYAVGDYKSPNPSIVKWNGSSWSQMTSFSGAANTDLTSIYCTSSTNCWAVGNGTGKVFYQGNGTTWTGVSLSALSAYKYNGVFCNSDTDCWAVGANDKFARRNGSSWADFPTGLPNTTYNGVFCNSTSDCWAVGNAQSSRDLIAHWNGASWSRDSGSPTPVADLFKVTCAASNDCWAVGKTDSGTNTVFVHYDGSSWSQFTTSGMPAAQLNSVAIISARSQPQAGWSESYP